MIQMNALETDGITKSVRKDAENGREAVESTTQGIENIKRSSQIVSDAIQALSDKTRNIGAILTVINEIASQTGLLSLNAAIIAAQAGANGKGFSVVASEIRELADRTAMSTKEIEGMIHSVQNESQKAVEAMKLADTSIREGEVLSLKSDEVLRSIVMGIDNATRQMELISMATIKQGEESKVIRSAMDNVSEMVNQIAGATVEQQKGSELILGAAEQMRLLTRKVQTSTREQSIGGKVIAKSTENINDMITRIKRACDEQSLESREIIRSVSEFKESTHINLESTQVLNEAVDRLSMQIKVLQKEMGNFVLTE
jgi:methyl-accepting chemotaxis protein